MEKNVLLPILGKILLLHQRKQDFYVIVPHYFFADEILNLSEDSDTILLRQYFITPEHLQVKLLGNLENATYMQMCTIMASILQKMNIPLKMVEYYVQKALDLSVMDHYIDDIISIFKQELKNQNLRLSIANEDILSVLMHDDLHDKYLLVLNTSWDQIEFNDLKRDNIEVFFIEFHKQYQNNISIAAMESKLAAVRFVNQMMNDDTLIISHDAQFNDMFLQSHGVFKLSATHECKMLFAIMDVLLNGFKIENLLSIFRSNILCFNGADISFLHNNEDDLNLMDPVLKMLERIRGYCPDLIVTINGFNLDDVNNAQDFLHYAIKIWHNIVNIDYCMYYDQFNSCIEDISVLLQIYGIVMEGDILLWFFNIANNYAIGSDRKSVVHHIEGIKAPYYKKIIFLDSGFDNVEKNADIVDKLDFLLKKSEEVLLHASNVVIIKINSKDVMQSIFLDIIIKKYQLLLNYIKKDVVIQRSAFQPEVYVDESEMPRRISASGVEVLMNNPYIFYLKYILCIKTSSSLWDKIDGKIFGLCVHRVLQLMRDNIDIVNDFERINDVILKFKINSTLSEIWMKKILNICNFIKDYELENSYTFDASEVLVSTFLPKYNIKISARIDAICYDADANSILMEYKTGYIPSMHDIKSGLRPQVLLSAWVLCLNNYNIKSCKYIKASGIVGKNKVMKLEYNAETVEKSVFLLLNLFFTNKSPFFATNNLKNLINLNFLSALRGELWA